ncbi:MAG: hypothetical protein JXQ84_08630 [Rhodospirillaceae bacterium]|nr:hypothetical protein [Rhodospirillaceae bacterium]
MRRLCILVLPLIALTACSRSSLDGAVKAGGLERLTPFEHAYQGLFAVDVATLIVTDKTMLDHIVSYFREEDCSAVRASQGDRYCRPIRIAYTPPPEPFCYRSLADVSCFSTPNPYGSDHRMGTFLPGITRAR